MAATTLSPRHESTDEQHVVLCKKCNKELERVNRDSFVRVFLSWLPLKKYFCTRCLRSRYVFGK